MKALTLSYLDAEEKRVRLRDLEEIFWLTATRAPSEVTDRELFFQKYAGVYIETWPDDVYIAVDIPTKKTLGYLVGCRNSLRAIPVLESLQKSYLVFEKNFKKFPAHLHMNVHPNSQGRGVGSFLFGQFKSDLLENRIRGVHIVTSPGETNVEFYRKCGFLFEEINSCDQAQLLFMGSQIKRSLFF